MSEEKILEKQLRRVRLARDIIQSKFFTEEEITRICNELGFSDTSFRDKKAENKLNDFLLDYGYWIKKDNA